MSDKSNELDLDGLQKIILNLKRRLSILIRKGRYKLTGSYLSKAEIETNRRNLIERLDYSTNRMTDVNSGLDDHSGVHNYARFNRFK